MILILYVSSVAMYLLEPVGCRIDPKGPSNIYIYILATNSRKRNDKYRKLQSIYIYIDFCKR